MKLLRPPVARASVAAPLALACSLAGAQSHPSKQIRIITSDAPGGVVDTLTRAVSARLTDRFQQPVIVENRPAPTG